jgi:hypothetical protein
MAWQHEKGAKVAITRNFPETTGTLNEDPDSETRSTSSSTRTGREQPSPGTG